MDTQPAAVETATVNRVVRESFPGSRIECTGLSATWATARSIPTDDDIRPGGFISGPTQFALADAALWYLVFGALGRIELMALTSELSIRYLRPAIGDVVHGRAELASISRRNVVGSVTVWAGDNEHRPSAVAQGTYALPLTRS